jgi:hypothetical protein
VVVSWCVDGCCHCSCVFLCAFAVSSEEGIALAGLARSKCLTGVVALGIRLVGGRG